MTRGGILALEQGASDVAKLAITSLRLTAEQCERVFATDPVLAHQDTFRASDEAARGQRQMELSDRLRAGLVRPKVVYCDAALGGEQQGDVERRPGQGFGRIGEEVQGALAA
jgi:hypothetical protein